MSQSAFIDHPFCANISQSINDVKWKASEEWDEYLESAMIKKSNLEQADSKVDASDGAAQG